VFAYCLELWICGCHISINQSFQSFICSETQIGLLYSATIKTWTLNKTHQAHDKHLWWPLTMFVTCVVLLRFLCVLVIILNFMCCFGLCSDCFSYWVAHKRSIILLFGVWILPVAPHLLYTVYVFCFCILCVTNKFDYLIDHFVSTFCEEF